MPAFYLCVPVDSSTTLVLRVFVDRICNAQNEGFRQLRQRRRSMDRKQGVSSGLTCRILRLGPDLRPSAT